MCSWLGTVFLSLLPTHIPNRQSDTIVPEEWARQPAVLPTPPKAQGTIPPQPVNSTQCSLTCVAWLARTLIAVDFVNASPVVAGFALTVVQVHLAVETYRIGAEVSRSEPNSSEENVEI